MLYLLVYHELLIVCSVYPFWQCFLLQFQVLVWVCWMILFFFVIVLDLFIQLFICVLNVCWRCSYVVDFVVSCLWKVVVCGNGYPWLYLSIIMYLQIFHIIVGWKRSRFSSGRQIVLTNLRKMTEQFSRPWRANVDLFFLYNVMLRQLVFLCRFCCFFCPVICSIII